jgi:RpiB/LacA/LacB family sugar-phosphate isomerase
MIYIASDHGGFKLKEHLKKFVATLGLPVKDFGPKKYDQGDDYPDYAAPAARAVSKNPDRDMAILICRSGQGVCIVANKFKNVRAALVWNTGEAKASRNDDMSNVLCLPSDYVSPRTAEHIVETWLETAYSDHPRHVRRVRKITKLES